MKVVNPNNASHDTVIIPRYYPAGALTLSLFNESTRVSTDVANTYATLNGELTITYTFTFADNDKYEILIKETDEVVYRGKIIATTQVSQAYKLSNGLYYYE